MNLYDLTIIILWEWKTAINLQQKSVKLSLFMVYEKNYINLRKTSFPTPLKLCINNVDEISFFKYKAPAILFNYVQGPNFGIKLQKNGDLYGIFMK